MSYPHQGDHKRKKRGRENQEAPFPVPIATITRQPARDNLWFQYTGELKNDHVIIKHSGDLNFLYRMGFFGKGLLSRGGPCLMKTLPSVYLPSPGGDSDVVKVMRRRMYLRHCNWKKSHDRLLANENATSESHDKLPANENATSESHDKLPANENATSESHDRCPAAEDLEFDSDVEFMDLQTGYGANVCDSTGVALNMSHGREEPPDWMKKSSHDQNESSERIFSAKRDSTFTSENESLLNSKLTIFPCEIYENTNNSNIKNLWKSETDEINVVADSVDINKERVNSWETMEPDKDFWGSNAKSEHNHPSKEIIPLAFHKNENDKDVNTEQEVQIDNQYIHISNASWVADVGTQKTEAYVVKGQREKRKRVRNKPNNVTDSNSNAKKARKVDAMSDNVAGNGSNEIKGMCKNVGTKVVNDETPFEKANVQMKLNENGNYKKTGQNGDESHEETKNKENSIKTHQLLSKNKKDRPNTEVNEATQNMKNDYKADEDIEMCAIKEEVNKQHEELQIDKEMDSGSIDIVEIKEHPYCVTNDSDGEFLVIDDSDCEDEMTMDRRRKQTFAWNPVRKQDSYSYMEPLVLSLEEAYFLTYGLGCLTVVNEDRTALSISDMWCRCCRKQGFLPSYVAYHYFRSKGWVPRSGVVFGTDFILYREGPPFFHGSYSVIVKTVQEGSYKEVEKYKGRELSWASLSGLNRVTEHVAKVLMLCYVIVPNDITDEELMSPDCLAKFKIRLQTVNRWVSAQEREDKTVVEIP